MTYDPDTFHADVIGPYSPWPRRQTPARVKVATLAGVGVLAAFAHCIAPMI